MTTRPGTALLTTVSRVLRRLLEARYALLPLTVGRASVHIGDTLRHHQGLGGRALLRLAREAARYWPIFDGVLLLVGLPNVGAHALHCRLLVVIGLLKFADTLRSDGSFDLQRRVHILRVIL